MCKLRMGLANDNGYHSSMREIYSLEGDIGNAGKERTIFILLGDEYKAAQRMVKYNIHMSKVKIFGII